MLKKRFLNFLFVFLIIIIFFSGNVAGVAGPPKTVITLPAIDITSTSATLRGSVNPNELSTSVSFYSSDPSSVPSFFDPTPIYNIGSGSSPVSYSYTLTPLKPGTTYSYYIAAGNSMGTVYGQIVTFTTHTSPTAPQTLKATININTIILDWNAPSSDGGSAITSYKIYRGTTSGGETFFTTSNAPAYTDTSAISGQTYYYKVSAVNSVGEGPMSNEASAAIPVPPTSVVIVTPATVTATPLSRMTVMVTSDSGSIGIGLTSKIKVTVTSGNDEIPGADVMMALTSTGKLNPGYGTTDPFGQFISTYTGSSEGIVIIRALVRKAGFVDGKGEVQITVSSIQTPVVTSNTSKIEQTPTSTNGNENNIKNNNITVPKDENETPKVDLYLILFVVTLAGIIIYIYFNKSMKLKQDTVLTKSVKKVRKCSNCGMEAPGDNKFCEKCGKPLRS